MGMDLNLPFFPTPLAFVPVGSTSAPVLASVAQTGRYAATGSTSAIYWYCRSYLLWISCSYLCYVCLFLCSRTSAKTGAYTGASIASSASFATYATLAYAVFASVPTLAYVATYATGASGSLASGTYASDALGATFALGASFVTAAIYKAIYAPRYASVGGATSAAT